MHRLNIKGSIESIPTFEHITIQVDQKQNNASVSMGAAYVLRDQTTGILYFGNNVSSRVDDSLSYDDGRNRILLVQNVLSEIITIKPNRLIEKISILVWDHYTIYQSIIPLEFDKILDGIVLFVKNCGKEDIKHLKMNTFKEGNVALVGTIVFNEHGAIEIKNESHVAFIKRKEEYLRLLRTGDTKTLYPEQ